MTVINTEEISSVRTKILLSQKNYTAGHTPHWPTPTPKKEVTV
jgi:hypothetical protein